MVPFGKRQKLGLNKTLGEQREREAGKYKRGRERPREKETERH